MSIVSVIIPTYNHARFVSDAVESALTQTYPDVEIIVVDDGSSDDTAQTVAAFGNQIRYIWQENQGLAAARNHGIRSSRGEYLAFLDADDRWLPTFLEAQSAKLSRSPAVGLTYCWWRHIDAQGKPLPEPGRYEQRGDLLHQLSLKNRWPPVAVLVRRTCVEEAGYFDGKLTALEDWDLWLRIAARGWQVDCLPEVLAEYRRHGRNMSLDVARMEQNQLAVLARLETSATAKRVTHLLPQARATVHLNSALSYHLQGKAPESYRAMVHAIQSWPPIAACEETWYRWICADQPPGYQDTGHFKDLDVAADRIYRLLARLFADPDVAPLIDQMKREIDFVAGIMLAEHRYRENDLAAVGRHLKALSRRDPVRLTRPRAVRLLLKSLLGKSVTRGFRRLLAAAGEQGPPQ